MIYKLVLKTYREHFLGIKVVRGCPRLNQLLFAYDTMFFCYADSSSCNKLIQILKDYRKASGQEINKTKSLISFSSKTPRETKENVKAVLGISQEGGEGKYLGLPDISEREKNDLFTSLVDRIRQRATSWATKCLSKTGKLTMLKSVLMAIPTYTMSCFQLPVSLCKRFQSVLTRYLWDGFDEKGKMCWISWTKLTKPKERGGLGFMDIQLFNQALLAKIAWRIITVPDCLLARILKGKYCHNRSFINATVPSVCSHGWRIILHGEIYLNQISERLLEMD